MGTTQRVATWLAGRDEPGIGRSLGIWALYGLVLFEMAPVPAVPSAGAMV